MQRRATRQSRAPNSIERRFQSWLKERPCVVTGEYGVQVHHCVGSSYKQDKVLIGHAFCLPLSIEVHNEYHAGTKAWREKYGLQTYLWLDEFIEFKKATGMDFGYEVERSILNVRK